MISVQSSNVAGTPTASTATSTPRPFVSSMIIATASSRLLLIVESAPNSSAFSSRASERSIATIWPGVKSCAVMIVASPIGPAPTTATVSPGCTPPFRTPTSYAVGRMSARNNTSSSVRPSGTLYRDVSANGTRANSAWRPSIVWPKIQPPPPVQRPYWPPLQYWQRPHEVMHETSTRSPGSIVVTAEPTSTTVPTASWPRIVPGWHVGTWPLRMCKSVPQIVDVSMRTMASVGSRIVGSETDSQARCPGP